MKVVTISDSNLSDLFKKNQKTLKNYKTKTFHLEENYFNCFV